MKIVLLLLCVAGLMGGCASTEAYKDYSVATLGTSKNYSDDYKSYLEASKTGNNGKIVSFKAAPGRPITIDAEEFTVYAPAGSNGGGITAPTIRNVAQIKDSEWPGTIKDGLNTVGSGFTTYVLGGAAKSIFKFATEGMGKGAITTTNTTTTNSSADVSTAYSANQQNTSTDAHNTSTDAHNTTTVTDAHNTSTDAHNTTSTTTHTPTSTTTITGAAGTTSGGTVTQ